MVRARSGAQSGLRYGLFGLTAILAGMTVSSNPADARHHWSGYKHVGDHRKVMHVAHRWSGYKHVAHRAAPAEHSAHVESYSPPSASIVIDGNTGSVLQALNPDALRHPASLTKIMTLYLLFEQLEAGNVRLDTPLKVSAHASEQAPTKLGLKPGGTIAAEDAIKAIVTQSANDVAVAVAENLGGDEEQFAKLMTQKARSLGMTRTTYVNASGLPDDNQVTTARDQAVLGCAIQERFPRYYKYFSTAAFVYHGHAIRNHNHLLGSVEGVDGIKTGFTRASGFNLVTSVRRGGRHLVAVVLGGPTAAQRDARMRELISSNIKLASLRQGGSVFAEKTEPIEAPRPPKVAFAEGDAPLRSGSTEPIRPLLVKTISYRKAAVQTAW
jgi:D-alanyl-D-alanine carboxypeptidase